MIIPKKYIKQYKSIEVLENTLRQARQATATYEDIAEMHNIISRKEEELAAAISDLRIAAVKKACVFGWAVIAKDFNTTVRTLKKWHRKYCPEVKDLNHLEERIENSKIRIIESIKEEEEKYAQTMNDLTQYRQRIENGEEVPLPDSNTFSITTGEQPRSEIFNDHNNTSYSYYSTQEHYTEEHSTDGNNINEHYADKNNSAVEDKEEETTNHYYSSPDSFSDNHETNEKDDNSENTFQGW